MRHIVLIVGTLTGGPIAGASILAVLNIYRFLLGGIGVFPSLIASVLLFIVLLLTYKLFNRSSNRIKNSTRYLLQSHIWLGLDTIFPFRGYK